MLARIFGVILQVLVLGIVLFFCALEALMFNDFLYDYPVSQIIVPQWYQLVVCYVFPILILLSLFLLLQKYLNSHIRNVSGILFVVLAVDMFYMAFILPNSVAFKAAQQNYVLSMRDMAGFILINLCVLISITVWQSRRIR
jgi:hypothetical protein